MASTCSSCGADIIWVTMRGSGKASPIDVWTVPDGTIRVTAEGGRDYWGEVVPKADRDGREPLFLSHFATCKHAAEHRKREATP